MHELPQQLANGLALGALYGLIAILAIGGIIFPLVGMSLLVMLLLDLFIQSRAKRAGV